MEISVCACEWICRRQPPTSTQGENKGPRCRNFVAPIFLLAWHKRVRFTCACREVLISEPQKNFSVSPSVCYTGGKSVWRGFCIFSRFFFDDMIDFEKVNKGSHVRLLCRGILWTVFEERVRKKRKEAPRVAYRIVIYKSVADVVIKKKNE